MLIPFFIQTPWNTNALYKKTQSKKKSKSSAPISAVFSAYLILTNKDISLREATEPIRSENISVTLRILPLCHLTESVSSLSPLPHFFICLLKFLNHNSVSKAQIRSWTITFMKGRPGVSSGTPGTESGAWKTFMFFI